MNEFDWIVAMEANPTDVATLCAFADWLTEQDDPRADGAQLLAAYEIVGYINGFYIDWYSPSHQNSNQPPYAAIGSEWGGLFVDNFSTVFSVWSWLPARMAAIQAYADTDDKTREKIQRELEKLYITDVHQIEKPQVMPVACVD